MIDKPSGTLSLAGTIRTANGWTYSAGTVDPGTSTVVFAGGTVTGSHALSAVDFRRDDDDRRRHDAHRRRPLTLTAGDLNGTGSLAAQGAISQASTIRRRNGHPADQRGGRQTFSGAATAAAGTLPRLVIDKPSGTLSLAGTIRTASGWTYIAGTLDPGNSTVVFAGGTVSAAGMAFYDVVATGGTTTLGAAMTVSHDLTVSGGIFTTSANKHSLSGSRAT